MPNWLDRTIGYVSPVRGARRLQARSMMEVLSYEGARKGRRTDGWITTSADADSESQAVVSDLRNRTRDLVRNNGFASQAADVKVTETIGAGIVAEVRNATLRKMWEAWIDNCDADGDLDLYGIQALAERCRIESGEVLIEIVNVSRSSSEISSGIVPIALRVMEPDYLDTSKDTQRPDEANRIRYGIEYGKDGRKVAYHLYHEHPGGSRVSFRDALGLKSRRVPAENIIHVYRRLRPGQTRGVPDLAPVILRARDFDDVTDAIVMRRKVEACLAAFVTSPPGAGASPIGPLTTDETGQLTTLYPAMVHHLGAGEGVEFSDPKTTSDPEFQRFALREIAAGIGVPYELMTGDLSQVNYSSYRAGLIRFRRRIEQDQWHVHIPTTCRRIWARFRAEADSMKPASTIGRPEFPAWTPPRFELIDPLKETQAEIEAVQAGFDTWEEVVRKRGWSAADQLKKIADWQKDLDRLGIVVTSDPRSSMQQAAAPVHPADDPDEPDSEEEAA